MKCHLMQKPKRKNKLSAADKRKLQSTIIEFEKLSFVYGAKKAMEIIKQRGMAMAQHRNCKHQGLGYKGKNGIDKCVCDLTGEAVCKSYCFNHCEDYQPRKKECGNNES